jgi:hypothetical protein
MCHCLALPFKTQTTNSPSQFRASRETPLYLSTAKVRFHPAALKPAAPRVTCPAVSSLACDITTPNQSSVLGGHSQQWVFCFLPFSSKYEQQQPLPSEAVFRLELLANRTSGDFQPNSDDRALPYLYCTFSS